MVGSAHRRSLGSKAGKLTPKKARWRFLNPVEAQHSTARGVGQAVRRGDGKGTARAAAFAARQATRAGAREGGRHERTRHPAVEDGRRATRAACSAGGQSERSGRHARLTADR